jgi:hypothetical protein
MNAVNVQIKHITALHAEEIDLFQIQLFIQIL